MANIKDNTEDVKNFSVAINKREQAQVRKIKEHYGFSSNKELFLALIKRASLNMK